MPRYEQSFRDICSLADSKKITDRRRCITRLKELYDSSEAIEELNENSRNRNGGTNWSAIMHSVHKVLLYEADRSILVDEKRSTASTSKSSLAIPNKDSVHRNIKNSATMLDTIKKANSSEIILNCDDLVSLVLQILPSHTYAEYHRTYLTILINQILPVKQYQIDMKSVHWKELLKNTIFLYEDEHSSIDKNLILKAMCDVVLHGCKQSHLTLRLKKIFPFLVKVSVDAKSDPRNLSENTFKLFNAVCEAIGPESRMALCEFGETVLRSAIDFNSSSDKYDWILLVVRAHHPGGVSKDHDASYACDWDKWNDILRLIYCMIINDCKLAFTSDSFVQLACEVSWQLRDDGTCIADEVRLDESCYEQPSKRRRTVIGIQGMIDTLTASPLKESKLSIQILIVLITRYPESIKERNFLPLMEFLIDYLNKCKDDYVTDQLWELGRVMVQLETKLSNNFIENDGIKLTWEKIWGITLRSVSTNKYEERVHKLLQSLIINKKVIDSNAFLNLYLKDTVPWSESSIHTLLTFCKHNIIQDCAGQLTNEVNLSSNNHVPVKVRLLQWVLAVPQSKWNAKFPIEDVCELLVGLTLKSWYDIDLPEGKSVICNKNLRSDLTNIENTYLMTSFEGDFYTQTDTKIIQKCKNVKENVLYSKENRDLLIRDLIEKNTAISDTDRVHFLMINTTVIAKVFSNLKQLNIAPRNIDESFRTIVKNSLQDISLSIEGIVKPKKKLKGNHLTNILEALYLFYKTPYDNDIRDIIRSLTEPVMLKNILLLTDIEKLQKTNGELQQDDSNTSIAYIGNMDDLSDRHRLCTTKDKFRKTDSTSDLNNIRMKACTILATFCRMVNGRVMSSIQEQLQIALLNPDNYDLSQMFDFRMAVNVLELLTDCEVSSFSVKIIASLLKLLQQLCRILHKDEEASSNILNILSKLFVHLKSSDSVIHRQNSLRILRKFHEFLQEDKYGPTVDVAFVECLETLAKIDPKFLWTRWQNGSETENGTPVVQDLLIYNQSPFHEVRLKAGNCLRILFSSKEVDLQWLTEFFTHLRGITISLFVVKGELKKRIKEDERTNRTASALHIMSVVISSSAIFRSEALLSMFQLTVDKNVNSNIVRKVLKTVGTSLGIENPNFLIKNNLNYLLTHWLEKEYPLHKFPIILANCESEKQFYQQYMGVVVPILIQKGNLKGAQDLCKKFSMSFKDVIESCFPRLISWMLPCISADPSAPAPSGINIIDIQRATNVFNQLKLNQNEFQTVQKLSTLLENNLESVILTMIKRLHDEQHSMQFLTISVNYPPSDPPHFKQKDIERSFKYLENKIIGTNRCLLDILATEKRHVLQRVLLNLKCSIHGVNSLEHKLKALHHYVYFSMMILERIDQDYFDEMSAYVVRDICHTMVYFIKENSGSISQAACSYFYYLLRSIPPKRYTEIKRNLRLIIASMIPIVKADNTEHAYDIMKFLIIEKHDVLGEAIEKLESFPMDEVFREVRQIQYNLKDKMGRKQSLEYEIKHFLNTRGESTEYCSSTELEHLKEQLSTKKTELRELYQSLGSTHRFSEDCASSILHQLICALVKLTTSYDPDISLGAAKCLGEIGPADLSTMILQPEKNHSKHVTDPLLLFTYRVVVLLSNLLIHSDMELFTASSEALYIIMASYWGQRMYVKKNLIGDLTEGSEELLQFEYIAPFINKQNQSKANNTIDKTKFIECVNSNRELWIGKSDTPHKDWITNITCNILDCFNGSYLKNLIPVCKANVSFCEKVLPSIILLALNTEKELNTIIYDNINGFFNAHFSKSKERRRNSPSTGLQKNTCFDHESVQCMLNVVDFIRSQSADNCQFELNYLHIAKAAQYCSAYFTSVLYAELWCEKYLREAPTIDNLTSIDYICEIENENGRVLQEILREAFIKIGDLDAIYGCGTSSFQNSSARIEHYVQLRKWDKVLLAHDIEMSLGNKTATKGLLDALQHSGLQYLLGAFVKTIDKSEVDIDDYRYECAWRLSDWNMPTIQQMMNTMQQDDSVRFQNTISNDYPLFHYHALKSVHERDTDVLKSTLDSARVSVIKTLRNVSLESCKTVYPALSQLQMLREIEEMYFAEPDTYKIIIEKWNNQDSIGLNDFEYIEPVLSQRIILLQAKGDDNEILKDALINTYLQITELSKKQGHLQMAARALGSLAKQAQLSAEVTDTLQYQEAMLAWMRGDQELGRHLLRNLIIKDSLSPSIHVQALTAYGNWMAETKSENPQKVIDKYYLTAQQYGEKIINPTENDKKNLLDTQAALAQFADTQYQQILTHMKSPQFESFKECVAYSEETAQKLSTSSKDYDEKRAACINKVQSTNDMAELGNIEREKDMYLLLALKHYMITLQQGEDHNLLVFRLISLWLDNTHQKELNEHLQSHLSELPSYKFVLLVPQLAPHMTDTEDIFSTQIYDLLKRCAMDHPHHTLPVLLSLMNLHKDHEFYKGKKKPMNKPEPRVLGAKKLVEDLLTTNIKPIVKEMHKLSYSLIMLANLETGKGNSQKMPVPNQPHSILHIQNFEHTLVPTLSIDIKPNKDYNNIISVQKYMNTFELVGGINAPKKVTCIGTDGIKRNQLVKGKDDLRQDAVMQQVFTVMNMLLRTSKEANKRKLNVRTYKVVPLTQRCGILEWCDNTMPISAILEGSSGNPGLHQKYYPKDYTTRDCRQRMEAVSRKPNHEKLRRFMDCCKHLHPVFHYFFLENFSSPEIWFERRLAYVHSVATTSIIGYILGLGDRHVNNILIDKSTAEVIHIDFGIAFEQGKVLPTPETVPFRLTRDIEAAMGVSGVEGVLRRSCEETMTVLRNQREVILTLLQVLLYDPLFSWAITPAKAYSLQKGKQQGSSEGREASGETNKLAERALLRLDQKLRGTEEGSAFSVAGQVEKLIQEARDPANLSRLYYGWQPYL